MLAGAEYTPAAVIRPTVALPPTTPPTCHVTAVSLELVTVAKNVCVPVPTSTFAVVGEMPTCTASVPPLLLLLLLLLTPPPSSLLPPPPPPQAAIDSTTEHARRWRAMRVGQLKLGSRMKRRRINRKSVRPNLLARFPVGEAESCQYSQTRHRPD
jgi:hypothetical protein